MPAATDPSTHITGRELRVAHIVRSLEVGGLERLVCDLAAESRQFKPIVICLTITGELGEQLKSQGIPVIAIHLADGAAKAIVRIASALRQWRIDVVHCHNLLAHLFGSISSRLIGIKCIVFSKHGTFFPGAGMGMRLNRLLLRRSHVVAVSQEIYALCESQLHPRPGFLHYIPNGLALSPYTNLLEKGAARARLQLPETGFFVGVVARLVPGKGHLDLLKGFAEFLPLCPDAKLLIVGDGEFRSTLQAYVAEHDLSRHVVFLGTRTDIPQILAALDAFALTSENEGIPMTILEAMAARLPVIATAVGGIPQVVCDGETGILVPLKDHQAVCSALRRLSEARDSARAMGLAGRARVEAHFSSGAMVQKYESLYLSLLNQC